MKTMASRHSLNAGTTSGGVLGGASGGCFLRPLDRSGWEGPFALPFDPTKIAPLPMSVRWKGVRATHPVDEKDGRVVPRDGATSPGLPGKAVGRGSTPPPTVLEGFGLCFAGQPWAHQDDAVASAGLERLRRHVCHWQGGRRGDNFLGGGVGRVSNAPEMCRWHRGWPR